MHDGTIGAIIRPRALAAHPHMERTTAADW
jgi:hypothetical protein